MTPIPPFRSQKGGPRPAWGPVLGHAPALRGLHLGSFLASGLVGVIIPGWDAGLGFRVGIRASGLGFRHAGLEVSGRAYSVWGFRDSGLGFALA